MRSRLSPRDRRTPVRVGLMLGPALMVLSSGAGCSTLSLLKSKPPKTTLTAIEPSGRPALKPYCTLPVMEAPPHTQFIQVAVVGASDGSDDDRDTLMAALVGEACPTGADALVMVYDSFNGTNTAEQAAEDYQKRAEFIRNSTVAERQTIARVLASAPRRHSVMAIAIVYDAAHPGAAHKPQS